MTGAPRGRREPGAMTRYLPFLALAFLLLIGAAQAQPSPSDQAAAVQDMEEAMDAMRAHPNFKTMIVGKIRDKAQSKGVTNLDAKMATIGTKLDAVAAMSDADYAAQKQQLAEQMLQVLEGP